MDFEDRPLRNASILDLLVLQVIDGLLANVL
jgi:hypothetical protein